MSAASYQSIREQLIALQVDLDDKGKVVGVLEQKVGLERQQLSRIEGELKDEYESVLENELREYQAELEHLRSLSSRCMQEKKELMEICKLQLDAIKDDEVSVQDQGKRIQRDVEEALELERKAYRANHEERLQKFLASKASEHRDQTGKALQPEFARLQLMHERELSDVETNAKSEERRMREMSQTRLEELVREERENFLDEQRNLGRSRSDAVAAELQAAEREHRVRLHALQVDLEKDLERYVAALVTKTDKERKTGQAELRKAQEACHARFQEIRSRHLSEMQALIRDHEDQMKELRTDSENTRAKLERTIRSGGGDPSSENYINDDDSENDNEGVNAVKRDAISQRDKRIQAEIRSLQAESVRLERSWKAKAESERNEIAETRAREEKEASKRQRNFTEQISDLAVTREALAQDVRILNEKVLVLSSDLLEGRREIEVYENGIAAHRLRLKDLEHTHSSRSRDEEMSSERSIESSKARLDKLDDLHRNREKMLEQELKSLEFTHVAEMEKLDREVKANIAQKDEDLELLRDAVQTEKVKIARLEKLNSSSSVSVATANTSKSSGTAARGRLAI